MLSASEFILPAWFIRTAQSAARSEFRSSYFKNTPQLETSGSESPNLPRAVGAENGERMESALWVRANSEGGQNEIEIVLSWSKGFVPKERRKSLISWRFSLVARNPARFESKIHFRRGSTQFFLSAWTDEDFAWSESFWRMRTSFFTRYISRSISLFK